MERRLSENMQGIIKRFFARFKRNKYKDMEEHLEQERRYEKISASVPKTYHVVDIYKQIINATWQGMLIFKGYRDCRKSRGKGQKAGCGAGRKCGKA